HDFNTFKKIREGATTFVSWEKSPKKEGTYPKIEITIKEHSETTKVKYRLQSLLIDYKICSVRFFRLQKFVVSAYFHYKVSSVRFLRLQKFVMPACFHYKVCSVRFLRLHKFVVSGFFHYQFVVSAFSEYKSLLSTFLTFSL
ncbi:hypothetical protein K443DRAFT_114353, partial [Laccaria amethystina LaAM-08-1]